MDQSDKLVDELDRKARELRMDVLRMIYKRGEGHPGGSLSIAEILAALFFHHLRIDPVNPDWPERDRFLLGKGHACATLYAALSRKGFFPGDTLNTFGRLGSSLQGHPDRLKTPGIDMTSGLLGHALSIAVGLGLAARIRGFTYNIYVLLGDGECQAGIIWEGAMAAGKYKLANITTIVDYNDIQNDGPVHEIMPIEPFVAKWESFGFEVMEINGHNMREVLDSLDAAAQIYTKPTVIIAHTTKGKGVSFMENVVSWHSGAPNDDQYAKAISELQGNLP